MQKILGHTDIKTTLRYTRLTTQTHNNAYETIDALMNGFSIKWGNIK